MLFSELLPRRDKSKAVCLTSFLPAIDRVNSELPGVVQGWRDDFPQSRIVLLTSKLGDREGGDGGNALTVNCGRDMFSNLNEDEFASVMRDMLHPNAKGYELWARCLR